MSDEAIVDVIAAGFHQAIDPNLHRGELIKLPLMSAEATAAFFIKKGAEAALVALRAKGWEIAHLETADEEAQALREAAHV